MRQLLGLLIALPLLTVCGPEGPSAGELQLEEVSSCQPEICGGLVGQEQAICILEHIQSGEPGYASFGFCCRLEGPVGTTHLLLHGDGTATIVDELDCEPYCDDGPDVTTIVIDPERVADSLDWCSKESACQPCFATCGIASSNQSSSEICRE